MSIRRIVKRIVSIPLILLAALWLFAEEWVWDRVAAMMAWLSRLSWVRASAAWVTGLPAYAAMALFGIPVALMLPFKIVGIWLIARGDPLMGVGIFILAKVVGTGIAAWIFAHCRDSLLSLPWFAAVHRALKRLHEYLRARVAELEIWRKAHAIFQAVRLWMSRLRSGVFKRRWHAFRRLSGRRGRAKR